jgi:hypothetical protein
MVRRLKEDIDNELMSWAETIPMDELWDKIRDVTGMQDLDFDYEVYESRGYVRIRFKSQNLADRAGFLRVMFKDLYIEEFNSEVYYKKEDHQPAFWGSASFAYRHPDGGSNGYTFLRFWYDDTNGWQFRHD